MGEEIRRPCVPCNPHLTDEERAKYGGAGGSGAGAGGSGGAGSGGRKPVAQSDGSKVQANRTAGFDRDCDAEFEDQEEPWKYVCTMMCKTYKYLYLLYHDKYRWEVTSRTIMFLLAIKLANECYGLILPVKHYKPFH